MAAAAAAAAGINSRGMTREGIAAHAEFYAFYAVRGNEDHNPAEMVRAHVPIVVFFGPVDGGGGQRHVIVRRSSTCLLLVSIMTMPSRTWLDTSKAYG